jgi:succinate dehydrogenase/fumarate reductase cytochrome b subunit
MKKILSSIGTGLLASQAFVMHAFAKLTEPGTNDGFSGLISSTDIKTGIGKIIQQVLDFILIIAVVYVIVAGLRLIVSGGDEGEKDKSKTTIIYVIVGIIIVLFARVIVVSVNNAFGN